MVRSPLQIFLASYRLQQQSLFPQNLQIWEYTIVSTLWCSWNVPQHHEWYILARARPKGPNNLLPSTTTMEQFPTEIILDIAAYLDLAGDKLALASLATCSQKYVEIVQPILFRTICPPTNAQMLRLLLTLKMNVRISALLKALTLSARMEVMTVALLTEILESGRLAHLEVLRFQQAFLPSGGTNSFPRLANAIARNGVFPALRVLEVMPCRLVDDIRASTKSEGNVCISPASFPKLEELYLGGTLTFGNAILPGLRALQARITSADLDRPFRAVNLRYLCTPSTSVNFRYLEELSAVTSGQLLSLECSGGTHWNLLILLEENGQSFKWFGEAFPQLRHLGGVWIYHDEGVREPLTTLLIGSPC